MFPLRRPAQSLFIISKQFRSGYSLRYGKGKDTALPVYTLNTQAAVHPVNQILRDAQAQTRALYMFVLRPVQPYKRLKQYGKLIRLDADAGIRHGDLQVDIIFILILKIYPKRDLPFSRILERISQEINDTLLDPLLVPVKHLRQHRICLNV